MIEQTGDTKKITLVTNQKIETLEAIAVAITVGQTPYSVDLGLLECGIAVNSDGIKTNEHLQTDNPDIYAAGDFTGIMMSAYVAMAQGRVAAENALGRDSKIDYQLAPRCVFTSPEMASVGLTEKKQSLKAIMSNVAGFPSRLILWRLS